MADTPTPQLPKEKPQVQQEAPKKNAGEIFLEEVSRIPERRSQSWWRTVALIPLLAVFTGLVIGGIFITFTTPAVYEAVSLGDALATAWRAVSLAYSSLFEGAIGNPVQIVQALQSGDGLAIRRAFNPILESLVT
ncbi:MAG TPA: hypothetical protein VLH85_01785, partial [Levilinea sp.]|nr:hypothetical protein [Levilinea sp.]